MRIALRLEETLHRVPFTRRHAMCVLLIALLLGTQFFASCRKGPPAGSQGSQSAGTALSSSSSQTADQQSCRAFVQKFYDWYWNQFAEKAGDPAFLRTHKMNSLDDVLALRPPVISDALVTLIRKDAAESKRTGDVGKLDFDPFLNTQDPQGKYSVTDATVANSRCSATIAHAHEVAELQKSGQAWVFVNFRYSYYSEDGKAKEFPDDDLIHILSK